MGDGAAGEMEELARYKCLGDDGSNVVVVEYRYVHNSHAENGSPRRYPGARHLILTTGEPVRYVDAYTFEVIESGERSEEHTSELQSLMRTSYAVFCLKTKTTQTRQKQQNTNMIRT